MSEKKYKFPPSFLKYRKEIRNQAVEMAEFLINEGLERNSAENIALSYARQWAVFCFNEKYSDAGCLNTHLIAHPSGWALISSPVEAPLILSSDYKTARSMARVLAKNKKLKLFIHASNGLMVDCECFIVNMPAVSRQRTPVKRHERPFLEKSNV